MSGTQQYTGNIAPADPAIGNLDENLTGLWLRRWNLLALNSIGFNYNSCFHQTSP